MVSAQLKIDVSIPSQWQINPCSQVAGCLSADHFSTYIIFSSATLLSFCSHPPWAPREKGWSVHMFLHVGRSPPLSASLTSLDQNCLQNSPRFLWVMLVHTSSQQLTVPELKNSCENPLQGNFTYRNSFDLCNYPEREAGHLPHLREEEKTEAWKARMTCFSP